MSVVLDLQISGNYEPTEKEILEYAKWLGMKLPEDEALLWIARDGLKAPLPEHWKACKSEKGDLYYFNFKTGESIWDHPLDAHFKELFAAEKAKASGTKQEKAGDASETEASKAKASTVKRGSRKSTHHTKFATVDDVKVVPTPSLVAAQPVLAAVKVKKELPEALRIDVPKQASITPLPTEVGAAAAEKEEPVVEKVEGIASDDALPHEVPVPANTVGLQSLKALAKMNAPNSPRTQQPEAGGEQNKGTAGDEKAEQRKKQVEEEQERALQLYKRQLEAERGRREQAMRDEMEAQLEAARKQQQAEHERQVKAAMAEAEARREQELHAMREQTARQLQQEQQAMELEKAQALQSAKARLEEESKAQLVRFGERVKQELQAACQRELAASAHDVLTQFAHAQDEWLEATHAACERCVLQMKRDMQERLAQEKAAHEVELQATQKAHAEAMQALSAQCEAEQQTERTRQQTQLSEVRQAMMDELNELRAFHRSELAALRSEMSAAHKEAKLEATINAKDSSGSVQTVNSPECKQLPVSPHPPTSHLTRRSVPPPSLDGTVLNEQRELKAVVGDVLREVLREMPPIVLSSPALSGGVPSPMTMNTQHRMQHPAVTSPASSMRVMSPGHAQPVTPHYLRKARRANERQRAVLATRRQQLKAQKRCWKDDMAVAKRDNLTAGSPRGQQLYQRRHYLEEQFRQLRQDEAQLREAEAWVCAQEEQLQVPPPPAQVRTMSSCYYDAVSPCSQPALSRVPSRLLYFPAQPTSTRSTPALGPATAAALTSPHADHPTPSATSLASLVAMPVNMDHHISAQQRARQSSLHDINAPTQAAACSHDTVLQHTLQRIERRLDEVSHMVLNAQQAGLTPSVSMSQARQTPSSPSLKLQAGLGQLASHPQDASCRVESNSDMHVDAWKS